MKKKSIPTINIEPENELATDSFSSWLIATRDAYKNGGSADVPCGECNACCRSSYFIHITPNEKETLQHIPKELLFSAPGLPKGNVLMGFDQEGRCPMLSNNRCSIYQYRPLTCRSYDCRVFSATGLVEEERDLISQQASRWKFKFQSEEDRVLYFYVRAAADFIIENQSMFPDGFVPGNPTQQAMLAIQVHDFFRGYEKHKTDKHLLVEKILTAVTHR